MSTIAQSVRDPLYTRIDLTPLEVRLIGTAVFDRLRDIHKPGFVDLVNPSLRTNLFAHSIGTAAAAGRLARHALDEAPDDLRASVLCTLYRAAGLDMPEDDRDALDELVQAIRLYGLLYHIGYPPFPSAAASAIRRSMDRNDIYNPLVDSAAYIQLLSEEGAAPSTGSIFQIVTEHMVQRDPELVAALSTQPRLAKFVVLFAGGRASRVPLVSELHALVAGLPGAVVIDAVTRDSHASGFGSGLDPERLTRMLCLKPHWNDEIKLCVHHDALPDLEQLFLQAHRLYRQVYGHAEVMFRNVVQASMFLQLAREGSVVDRLNRAVGGPPLFDLACLNPLAERGGRYASESDVSYALRRLYDRAANAEIEVDGAPLGTRDRLQLRTFIEICLQRRHNAIRLWDSFDDFEWVDQEFVASTFVMQAMRRHDELGAAGLGAFEAQEIISRHLYLNFLASTLLQGRKKYEFQNYLLEPRNHFHGGIFLIETALDQNAPWTTLGVAADPEEELSQQVVVHTESGLNQPLPSVRPELANLQDATRHAINLFVNLITDETDPIVQRNFESLRSGARAFFVDRLLNWAFEAHPEWDPVREALLEAERHRTMHLRRLRAGGFPFADDADVEPSIEASL